MPLDTLTLMRNRFSASSHHSRTSATPESSWGNQEHDGPFIETLLARTDAHRPFVIDGAMDVDSEVLMGPEVVDDHLPRFAQNHRCIEEIVTSGAS